MLFILYYIKYVHFTHIHIYIFIYIRGLIILCGVTNDIKKKENSWKKEPRHLCRCCRHCKSAPTQNVCDGAE